jgi:ubiquinone/menaquinone biosynthesis C-methylase UbiE/copper chaperone CopZ
MPKTVSYSIVAVMAFLLGGFSIWLIDPGHRKPESKPDESRTSGDMAVAAGPREFSIEGMSCQGCADTITAALTKIPGVQSAKVSLEEKRAVVTADTADVPSEKILAAITAAGYEGKPASATQAMPATIAKHDNAPMGNSIASYPAEMNKKFVDPKADIEPFVKRFENESRDIYAKRREIVQAVGLRPGEAVADIGAGTGLFTLLFAEQVAPKGTVYAVDIGPAMLQYIAEQAEKLEYMGVITPVLNTQNSAMLPSASIDTAFICDTYHHFERPEKMLASVHRALRPGGRLIIIDFDLHKGSSEFVKQRARAPKEDYFREITSAGFKILDVKNTPAIQDNFYAEFQRLEGNP